MSTATVERGDEADAGRLADPHVRERFLLGDPLRALAALGVVERHLVNITQADTGATLRESFGRPVAIALGSVSYGFYIFFALSGYLIGKPFITAWIAGRPGPRFRPYLMRRLIRIVPAFWLFVTLAVVLLGLRGTSPGEALAVYGLVQDFEPSPLSYDFAQAWTLHVEIVFYLLLPAVFAAAALFVRRNRMAWLLGGLAATWVAGLALVALNPAEGTWGRFPLSLYAFAPGLLLAAIAPWATARLKTLPARLIARASLVGVGVGALLLALHSVMAPDDPVPRAVVVSMASLVLLGTALGREWGGLRPWRVVDTRVMHWLGKRSYGIYVIHFVVIVEVTARIETTSPIERLLIATAISVPITIVLAALSWRFFESPILDLRRRRLAAAKAAAVTAGRRT